MIGISLGQLPPAEMARLKAELAETLVANFCYPRFFDHRTGSLSMRPVDRSKRQDVWLYLSSFDFTAWDRVDLLSPDFQHHVEGLFIQFVQRNRSFFGNQGRKRMSDIRMLINSCASSVAQGLRNHITNQKQGDTSFGSPRPVVSWSGSQVNSRPDLAWEQIAPGTMALQQQLQELRGEMKPGTSSGGRATNGSTKGTTKRGNRGQRSTKSGGEFDYGDVPQTPTIANSPATPLVNGRPATPMPQPVANGSFSAASSMQARQSDPLGPLGETPVRSSMTTETPGRSSQAFTKPSAARSPSSPMPISSPPTAAPGQREMLTIGEDDVAIFEQMRHQLFVWLRVEAVRADLEIANQGPSQLLELLRQQGRLDDTRLQVVSTLLNLANQVIKTRVVSILDYKQALMFHLMHTRR